MTARLYLIGDPVAHSLSPLLHGAMIAQTGADCTYEARRVRATELPAFLTEAKAACAGFNVTMPLKEAIVPLLDGLDASARECGAVNTVCIRQGRAIGHNTDGSGFVDSLRARGIDPAGMTVLLLGAGGAAEAVCTALVKAGAARLYVANRTVDRAHALAARCPEVIRPIPFDGDDLTVPAANLGRHGFAPLLQIRVDPPQVRFIMVNGFHLPFIVERQGVLDGVGAPRRGERIPVAIIVGVPVL